MLTYLRCEGRNFVLILQSWYYLFLKKLKCREWLMTFIFFKVILISTNLFISRSVFWSWILYVPYDYANLDVKTNELLNQLQGPARMCMSSQCKRMSCSIYKLDHESIVLIQTGMLYSQFLTLYKLPFPYCTKSFIKHWNQSK